jgi:hypothetical protein
MGTTTKAAQKVRRFVSRRKRREAAKEKRRARRRARQEARLAILKDRELRPVRRLTERDIV